MPHPEEAALSRGRLEGRSWAEPGLRDRCMARRQRHGPPRPASQRQLRVGELVRHAVSEMLIRGDVHDPVLEGHLITVPEVRMTPDLRLATLYFVAPGGRD